MVLKFKNSMATGNKTKNDTHTHTHTHHLSVVRYLFLMRNKRLKDDISNRHLPLLTRN